MIVNEAFARLAWPGESALGKRLHGPGGGEGGPRQPREVIGVGGDMREDGLREAHRPAVYYPIRQVPPLLREGVRRSMFVLARTAVDPLSITKSVQGAVRSHEVAGQPALRRAGIRSLVMDGSPDRARAGSGRCGLPAGVPRRARRSGEGVEGGLIVRIVQSFPLWPLRRSRLRGDARVRQAEHTPKVERGRSDSSARLPSARFGGCEVPLTL